MGFEVNSEPSREERKVRMRCRIRHRWASTEADKVNPMTRPRITNATRFALWRWITLSGIALTALLGLRVVEDQGWASSTPEPNIKMTGQFVPGMESYDRIIAQLMDDHDVPGAAVAVVHHGRLVYARGFGMADRENGAPVQPDSLFRIASISKPITAVAVLKLVEEGRLELDARVFRDLLRGIEPHPVMDDRMDEITVRHLLRHSGGFDRKLSGDPMFKQKKISGTINKPTPLDCTDVISYMKRQSLDFSPGERYAYSNFGYCALGRVIEQISRMAYEDYVRREILVPSGLKQMRVADPFVKGRLENEVKYYDYPWADTRESLDPNVWTHVPRPYTGMLSPMDAHGGWASSAIDLLRFVVAVDGRDNDDLVSDETIELMTARPHYREGKRVWYGLGWLVRDLGRGRSNWWHGGSLPGTTSLVVRAANGSSWAVVMNSRPRNRKLGRALDRGMWKAFRRVTQWPRHDLFSQFR